MADAHVLEKKMVSIIAVAVVGAEAYT